jgi:hypothetical protein
MSDWNTVPTKKYKGRREQFSQDAPVTVFDTVVKSNPSQVSSGQIWEMKDYNKQFPMSFQLSSDFDKINKMFVTSTQYLETRNNINHNQANHNKWVVKRRNEETPADRIITVLSKMTPKTFNSLIDDITKEQLEDHVQMSEVVDDIFNKIMDAPITVKLFSNVICSIIKTNNWIVNDDNAIPITFRKMFMNKIETFFNESVRIFKYEYKTMDIYEIVSHKTKNEIFFTMMGVLFNNNIISHQLIRLILTTFENAYTETKISIFTVFWSTAFMIVGTNWEKDEPVYYEEAESFINMMKDDDGLIKDIETHMKMMMILDPYFLSKAGNDASA